MTHGSGCGLCVFRDTRRIECTAKLREELRACIARSGADGGVQAGVDGLVQAGTLEAGLADADAASGDFRAAAGAAAGITDWFAQRLFGCAAPAPDLGACLGASVLPESLVVSPPEGFAYYGLHPLSFADAVARAAAAGRLGPGGAAVAVVGLRSIGTTLSAIVTAALRCRGFQATRWTVRPSGHPYARSLPLEGEARTSVQAAKAAGATFLVVDEGPGLSGSSLLAVGEALRRCGVDAARILLTCSRRVNPAELLADDAPRRWSAFSVLVASGPGRTPDIAGEDIGGGAWRRLAFDDESIWPSAWTQMERAKFLSRDARHVLRFEGLGPFGARTRQRAQALHDAGWTPEPRDEGDGFVSYALAGRPLRRGDLSSALLARMARYCAERATLFALAEAGEGLADMVRANEILEFGRELPARAVPRVERPVVADARMRPCAWVRSRSGRVCKVDAVTHGDDHFFPGPTDIAWDLAGTVVEWDLDDGARERLVEGYRRASGDDPRPRLAPYIHAYAVQRMSYCRMAADAVGPGTEGGRLMADCARYRQWALRGA